MTTTEAVSLFAAVFWLAWSNGANDNFKGVATLYGSGTTTFRTALVWATIATALGSMVSVYLAEILVRQFSGAGIVPTEQINGTWLITVGVSGAVTILLATILGMPTSTTHALTGAMIGAALVANPDGLNWDEAWTKFAQPLLLSPILAIGASAALYPILRRTRLAMGIKRQTCVCIGNAPPQPILKRADGSAVLVAGGSQPIRIELGETDRCTEYYEGSVVGVQAQSVVAAVHYLSAGAVCFGRAVNDTPKIAALLLAAGAGPIPAVASLLMVAAAMAMGGLVHARKVAETMSKRITMLNPGQGLTANLVTAALVLGASRLGVPVSTTHVSCGSIFGIGLVNGQTHWKTIAQILVTWLTTLPLGLVLGAGIYWVLN